MMHRCSLPLAGLLFVATALCAGRALQAGDRGRSFLTLTGEVTAVETARDEEQREWVVAILIPDGGPAGTRIRVAPRDVLVAQEYAIEAGQRLKVRVFTDESPYLAQQIRNQDNGRVLRLRSLRGEPLWDSGCLHHRQGAAPGSGRQGQRPHRGGSGR